MKIGAKMTVGERRFLGFCERPNDYADAVVEGCEIFGFTSGEFSIIDVIRAVACEMDRPRIVISTWTAAGADMGHVYELMESGVLSNARWIVDRSFQNRQPKLCRALRDKFSDDAVRVQRVHCKFTLLDDGERQVLIQTSANLNKNLRIENVSVSPCPVMYRAYADLVDEIFDTQMPSDGFKSSQHVTASFKQVAGRKMKRKTVPNPWAAKH